ncbi:MAG: ferrous iron transport protein A [Bacilli bacterium]|nr:ferrous iron transport protein A [Bacilli bacterium]MCR5422567.1 ferrous iron transport protein A [Bacilli bacterium]
MEKFLNEMVQGEQGTVKKVVAEGKIKRRLFDMGVTPGANVTFKKVAPLGDPIEINIRGYELSLRKDEADKVLMEVK